MRENITVENSAILLEETIELDTNNHFPRKKSVRVFEVMHLENVVVRFAMNGKAKIFNDMFMPYDLYLDENDENDLDIMINNINNFIHWCASRVLSLDRKYAKELFNSIGVVQAITDKDRADISLSYHCVSLTDVYWVREENENITFSELNLYDNTLNEAIVDLALKGRQMTVTNHELAPDLSTKGCFPKAWVRGDNGFKLLKDGGEEAVKRELLASQICQCFDIKQVTYREGVFDGEVVTESDIVTSKEFSMVSKMAFDIYAANHDLNTIEVCKKLDPVTYYGMNILDYLTGNTDRHPENWGFLVDNSNNKYISLYPLMDFNQCFLSYDNIDGANCQTVAKRGITQREAAIEAVKCIGLRQKKEIDVNIFGEMKQEAEMFELRLSELKKHL